MTVITKAAARYKGSMVSYFFKDKRLCSSLFFQRDQVRNFWVSLLCFSFPILSFFLDKGGINIHGHFLSFPGCAFKTFTGIPCPFCGMTRAFCEVSNFHIEEAFDIHPVGVLIYFLCIISGLFFFWRGTLGKPFIDLRKGKYWTPAFNVLLVLIGIVWLVKLV